MNYKKITKIKPVYVVTVKLAVDAPCDCDAITNAVYGIKQEATILDYRLENRNLVGRVTPEESLALYGEDGALIRGSAFGQTKLYYAEED